MFDAKGLSYNFIIFLEGGVKVIFDDEAGGGVSQKVIFNDKGGGAQTLP